MTLSDVRLRLEALRLRLLPYVAKDYVWTEVDGFRLFGRAAHQRFLSRFQKGPIEPFASELFCRSLKPGATVLDVGANLGYYTLLAARRVGAAGTVFAFECDATNYRFLLHNLRLNRYDATVVPDPHAVSDEVGVSLFHVRRSAPTRGSLWHRKSDETVQVPCTTLDRVLGDRPVDVVKIDIEGGELRALDGMKGMIASSPDLVMFVECNPRMLAAAGASVPALLERLDALGFEARVIHEKERELRPVSDALRAKGYSDKRSTVNLYCTRS